MRKGWQLKSLGAVADFKGGGTPSTEVPGYWNGEIPWVSPKDMKTDQIGSSIDRITLEAVKNSAASIIPTGSILIVVRSGILARTIPTAITTHELTVNQDIKALCPHSGLDGKYLHYFLRSAEKHILSLVTTGATVHRLMTENIKSLQLPLPPLPEQKRIVAILDEAFEGIDTAIANAEKNLASARELFSSYAAAVLENGDAGWLETTIGRETNLQTGFAFRSPDYTSDLNGIRLLRGDNIVQGELRWDDVKRWPSTDRTAYSEYELEEDDIVLAMDRTWVKAGIKFARISRDDVPALLVQRVARMRCRKALSKGLLFHLLGSRLFEKYVLDIQTGLGVPHISGKQIQAFRFKMPSTVTQHRIVEKLNAMRAHGESLVKNYQAKLALLKTLKQSTLQKAFAGELNAPAQKIALPEAAE